MSYNVLTIAPFDKQIKRLARKYHSLKTEFAALISSLEEQPIQGKAMSNNCYKIRMAIKSKGKGKSGGARIIIHLQVSEKTVFLLSITINPNSPISPIKKSIICFNLLIKSDHLQSRVDV